MKRNIAVIGNSRDDGILLQVCNENLILRDNFTYHLSELPCEHISVRPLIHEMMKATPEKALEGADCILQLGEVGYGLRHITEGKKIITFEEYVAEVKSVTTTQKYYLSCPIGYFSDVMRMLSELHFSGYSFRISSTDPELSKTLAFIDCSNGYTDFELLLKPDTSAANVCKTWDKLLNFARQSVKCSELIRRMRELFHSERWERNILTLPPQQDDNTIAVRLSLSQNIKEISAEQLDFIKWLKSEKVTKLPSVNRTEIEEISSMLRREAKKAENLEAQINTGMVKIQNLGDMIISFIGSRKCNLRCKYCFSEHSHPETNCKLSSTDIIKTCDMLTYGLDNTNVHFDNCLGGEPALEFEDVAMRHENTIAWHKTSGIPASFGILTNGTLMHKDFLEWLRSHVPYVGFSLDGDRDTNNKLRSDSEGRPSYDRTIHGIRMLQRAIWPFETGISSVITKYNLDIKSLRKYIIEKLHINNIVMKPVRACQDSDFALTYKDLTMLTESYGLLLAWMFDEAENKNLTPLFSVLQPLDYLGRFLLRVFRSDRFYVKRCGAGEHIFSVSNSGGIYPCDSFNGVVEIGNLSEGLHNRNNFHVPFVNEENPAFGCSECSCRFLCGGICSYVKHLNKNIHNDVTRMECELARFLITESVIFWHEASKLWPEDILSKVSERINAVGFAPVRHGSLVYAPC